MKKLLILIFSLSLFVGYSQEKITFEERNISIVPPEGFKKVNFYVGFFNYSNGASIQIEPIDSIAYVLFAEGFTKEVLQPQGVSLISKEDVRTDEGKTGILITSSFNVVQTNETTQKEETRRYERLTYLTGDMNRTIFINANYPVLVKELVHEPIKKSLLTAKFEE